MGSVPAAVATLLGLHYFYGPPGDSKIITTTLGIALLLTSVVLILRTCLRRLSRNRPNGILAHPIFTILTGLVLGFLVTISSVGAGALGVTALFFLYPQLKAGRIVGSDLAHAVPLTLVAGIGHWIFGSVDWRLLLSLLVGSLPGIYLGSQFAGRIPETLLRFLLAVMLVLVGSKLIAF
jgi:uncharacterized protein